MQIQNTTINKVTCKYLIKINRKQYTNITFASNPFVLPLIESADLLKTSFAFVIPPNSLKAFAAASLNKSKSIDFVPVGWEAPDVKDEDDDDDIRELVDLMGDDVLEFDSTDDTFRKTS